MNKLKSYKFWVSICGVVFLVLQLMGVKINAPYINEILTAILGVMVALGFINKPNSGDIDNQPPIVEEILDNANDDDSQTDGGGEIQLASEEIQSDSHKTNDTI